MTWRSTRVGTFLLVGLVGISMALTAVGFAQEPSAQDGAAQEAPAAAATQDDQPSKAELVFAVDNMVLLGAAVLVLLMQSGFAMLEVGLNAAKNATNILFKNFMDMALGVLLYFFIGYGLMFPGDAYAGKFFGWAGFDISEAAPAVLTAGELDPQVKFLFQVAFAATAATIVSGAVAGRMKFSAYLVYSCVISALIYPISGMWVWGSGWLAERGFHDFAGSVVVHAVGGFAGLAGALILGPRIGRFVKGRSIAMPGHNLAFAALGVFVLWVGWYGFNPGSQLAFAGTVNTHATVLIAVNTTLAAAAGTVVSMILAWALFGKPDLTMALNGALAGLVGITANCDAVTNLESIVIGAVAGVIVVAGILLLDKLKIDDPVGAFPVHGLCGVWGGIATGIFGEYELGTQLLGSLVIPLWSFATMSALFLALKAIGLLRVDPEEEQAGLDITEHGMHAYPPALVVDSTMLPAGAPIPVSSGGRS